MPPNRRLSAKKNSNARETLSLATTVKAPMMSALFSRAAAVPCPAVPRQMRLVATPFPPALRAMASSRLPAAAHDLTNASSSPNAAISSPACQINL